MNDKITTLDDARASKRAVLYVAEAATILDLDPRSVSKGIEAGEIPSIRVGRRIMIPREKFLRMFD